MITKVSIKNFRGIRSAEFKLGRINLLIGPNASGKTSVLDALNLLYSCVYYPPKQIFQSWFDRHQLRSRGADKGFEIHVSLQSGDNKATIAFVEEADYESNSVGTLMMQSGQSSPLNINCTTSDGADHFSVVAKHPALMMMRASSILRLNPRILSLSSVSAEARPQIGPDGDGLAAALAELAISDPAKLQSIENALKEIVPTVTRLRLQRSKVVSKSDPPSGNPPLLSAFGQQKPDPLPEPRDVWGHSVEFDFVGAASIPSSSASEGCLLTLGLLAVALGPNSPSLLLLDELERGLHPRALKALVLQLKKILDGDETIQIVATTHSPYLVDHFQPEEILVTGIAKDGSAKIAPLTAHPDFGKWALEMSPGEFWTSVGEDWVDQH